MKADADLLGMTPAELRREVMRLRTAFRKEASQTGNHRCWINLLPDVNIKPLTLSESEFIGNCKKYWKRNQ
jgi:hypothetical protein